MVYRKISVELVVFADEAEAVVAKLNSAIDRLEEAHTIFGGDVESGRGREERHAQEIGADAHAGGRRCCAGCRQAGRPKDFRRVQEGPLRFDRPPVWNFMQTSPRIG